MSSQPSSVRIEKITQKNKKVINAVTDIHLETFKGFFLTFMGKGFLRRMYSSYIPHKDSGLLVAFDGDVPVGFLAYSKDISGLYKYMIKHKLPAFIWYSFCAFLRKPKTFFRLFRALSKPAEYKRNEKYVQLSSLGVSSEKKGMGIGSALLDALKQDETIKDCDYVSLETDAENNDSVNNFYLARGFEVYREFTTREGRKMNEYRFKI